MLLRVEIIAACMAGSYLLGSLCFGIIFTKLFKKLDIRDFGSGNAGMTNVLRVVGILPGILTAIGDFSKAILAMSLAAWAFPLAGMPGFTGKCVAGVCVLLGHIFPVFFRFRGGKGVMTTGGIVFIISPYLLAVELAIFGITFSISRTVSLAALVAAGLLPVANLIFCAITQNEMLYSTLFMALLGGIIFITHRANIQRLRYGTESKLVIKKDS